MSKIFLVSLITTFSVLVQAATESEVIAPLSEPPLHSAVANINSGNYEVGGSFSASSGPALSFISSTVTPSYRYFFADRFSAGFVAQGSFGPSYTEYGGGPSLAFYFLNAGRLAFFIGEDLLILRNISSNYYSDGSQAETVASTLGQSQTHLGANYFVTRDVAVGPSVSYNYTFGQGLQGDNSFNVLGQFSIYF